VRGDPNVSSSAEIVLNFENEIMDKFKLKNKFLYVIPGGGKAIVDTPSKGIYFFGSDPEVDFGR